MEKAKIQNQKSKNNTKKITTKGQTIFLQKTKTNVKNKQTLKQA